QFQFTAVRSQADDATAAQLQLPAIGPFRRQKSEIADRGIEPAIDPQFESIGGVVGGAILKTKGDVLHQGAPLLGHAVAVPVDELTDVGRGQEIKPVMIPDQSSRRIDVCDKNLHLVGLTIVIKIPDAQDTSAVWFAIERPVAVAGNVDGSVWGGRDKDRVIYGGWGGEDRDIEVVGIFHFLEQ